ncbi:bacteriohemerythrin [Pelosinus propionicus]|uniref:Hemerythrin n=1 Tax=Pelosinus propionicus DSM 13327 TaxID=1123291 RepID=A0A1I4N7G9_9FIRM|nr:hemerythrin family protein [Pelosinus propionicus]SFM11451.1 hemerythrin [Pelosinus propionicus DSM 13327]
MVKWEDKYSLGVESIDAQHQELFHIANRIYELLKNEMILDKFDHIMEIIDELKNYTVDHFKDEEEYMKSIGYKKFLSHKVAHTDFLDKMESIDVNKIDNGHNEYLLGILDFVCVWLVEHIMKEDKLIVA